MKEEVYKKRIAREREARKHAEQLLEEKSREIYLKNKELERLNKELDISLSKTSEELLSISAEHRQLFDNPAVGVVMTKNGYLIQSNNTFLELTGYSKDEILGKHVSELIYSDTERPSEIQVNKVDGKQIRKFSIQKRYKRKNGSIFWGSTHITEIKGKERKGAYLLAIIIDIHRQKVTERKLYNTVQELQEVNTNLDSFAHIVSHDLKAPLTGINTILTWMDEKENDSESEEYIHLMQDRVAKMYALIEDIIDYSRVSVADEKKSLFYMKKMIKDAILLLDVPTHIAVTLSGEFPKVLANKAKLTQVFTNLLDNAIRHIDKDKGTIAIHCREGEKYYYFNIRDNGTGIEAVHYSKIFQIFNSLTPGVKSTGIGLSLVKKIIEQLGGKISVDSKVGEFTNFSFTLAKDKVEL